MIVLGIAIVALLVFFGVENFACSHQCERRGYQGGASLLHPECQCITHTPISQAGLISPAKRWREYLRREYQWTPN